MANYTEKFAAWSVICLTDHTFLDENGTEDDIRELCNESVKTCPFAAAVCVYPKFVKFINEKIKQEINPFKPKIACVINFPYGTDSMEKVLNDTEKALDDGADEIDLVINYKKIIENTDEGLKEATKLTQSVKKLLTNKILKVIIEVGELKTEDLIIKTTLAVLNGNADFIKTSTGKVQINATPSSVEYIIKAIKEYIKNNPEKNNKIGLKVSGGISDLNTASHYILLARRFLSSLACHPDNFRIGSSSLVIKLRKVISQCPL
ncbi:deoxyribose-phosphate aldolase, putative [Plasmodium yoelii]|uniref:Deoxyribose-phosphate aldolase n=3 Tax=Plasmodium yoelii TaxID=5861 RepID=Q7RMC9_PLAYO|nr:deoxyribose-phosphate aldolase, putative [Plasmodium yoelii]EAA21687.1 deoxyribose-phosphate aldolase [Plasmodium yoelii yoelii]WBY55573.1 deoxyribose-phosphate aldolase [Plasmodium yoelii yoelii]CDU16657.1 deoxyribose-phosphate aldolase, putative [Plasmodium yoelii]VTZ74140.1 deoxyribose-phosphate aldolase, putative [Plasmodium yoelii]|eukprot:XP_730122.1 deoxyribose-phosphate aldolase, putative [Plasmodium yoelii]